MPRDFERSAPAVVIVNETMARKFFGKDNPLGQRLNDSGPNPPPGAQTMEIVGVAADMKFDSLRTAPPAIIYLPLPQHGSNHKLALNAMGVALRTRQDAGFLERALRRELAAVHPAFTLAKMTTQSKLVHDVLVRERLLATVGSFFGAIALLLAGLGLYGTMSYSVSRRTREIGIRMAVGAGHGRVLRMILREALLIVATGAAVGVPAAVFAARPIAGLLFEVEPQDSGTMLLGAAMLVATSLIAAYIPALRASRTEPMEALRNE